MRKRLGRVVTSVLLVAAGRAAFGQSKPTVVIDDPKGDRPIHGQTRFAAHVEPASVTVMSIDYVLDGVEVCRGTVPHFDCTADIGRVPRDASLSAHALLGSGEGVDAVVRLSINAPSVFRSSVRVVYVPTVVSDSKGHPVKGLDRTSFAVTEDGVPQTVEYFRSDTPRIDLGVAIDVSGSMAKMLPDTRRAVATFVGSFRAADSITIIAFNDRVYVIAPPEADPARRRLAIDSLTASGGTALYDAMLKGLEVLGNDVSRRALVVFTDGQDWGSLVPLEVLRRRVRASDVSVYIVAASHGNELRVVAEALTGIVANSAGRFFAVNDTNELRNTFQQIFDELTQQYLLGYTPTRAGTDAADHAIHVSVVGHPEFVVRSRSVYTDNQ